MYDIHFQRHVVIHEIRQCFLVCNDASNLCCCQENIIRLLCCKKIFHILLSAQIQLLMSSCYNIVISGFFQRAHDCGANHAAMSCHINFGVFFHHDVILLSLCNCRT